MGRQKTNTQRTVTPGVIPPAFGGAGDPIQALRPLWDAAVDAGLMEDGTEVNYRVAPELGVVLSDAIGLEGQLLVDGRELTQAWAAELRRTKPAFSGLIDIWVRQTASWVRLSPIAR